MTAAQLRRMYRGMCQQDVTVRRYVGPTRTKLEYQVKGNAQLYGAKDLIGTITQGDMRVIVLAEDLENAGFNFPLTTDEKVLVGLPKRERATISFSERKALDGTLIALEIQARG